MKIDLKKVRIDVELFLLLFLFVLSTIFFIFQNYSGVSWDFLSYVLNAKYLFSDGSYFEILRPPLASVIIGVLSLVFGWMLLEYIFIVLVSAGFMYSSYKFAKSVNLDPVLFYALSLSPFLLKIGLVNGTELLSLVFLELALVFLIKESYYSGLFLALSALSRYTGLVFFVILLFHRRLKVMAISLSLFGLTFVPWFIYNYYKFGNFFMSIADQYANNILYRSYIEQGVDLMHILEAGGILLFFGILGVALFLVRFVSKLGELSYMDIREHILKHKVDLIMLGLFLYTLFSYANIPIKGSRYLFLVVFPLAYFTYLFLDKALVALTLKYKLSRRKVVTFMVVILLIINSAYLIIAHNETYYEKPHIYEDAIENLDALGYGNCSLMSNAWVFINYYGKPSDSFPKEDSLDKRIEEGHKVLIYHSYSDPPYSGNRSYLLSKDVLYDSGNYVILGREDRCLEESDYDISYLEGVRRDFIENRGEEINVDACFIIFHDIGILERSCNFVNFNGFTKSDNRKIP